MSGDAPLVSIGLPVYNGMPYLKDAFDDLLAQDFADFELIVSDNASTDGTWQLCQQYAELDLRIRLFRNTENQGSLYNFHRVFELANGKYFMWAAHDDGWEPTYISTCLTALEARPEAVLAYTQNRIINHITQETEIDEVCQGKSSGDPFQRALNVLSLDCPRPNSVYGVFRRNMLAELLPWPRVYGSDRIILLRAVLRAPTVLIEEPLRTYNHYYAYRIRSKSEYMRQTIQAMAGAGATVAPDSIWRHQLARVWLSWYWYLRLFTALMDAVWRSDLGLWARGKLTWAVLRFMNRRDWPLGVAGIKHCARRNLSRVVSPSFSGSVRKWLTSRKL